MLKLSDLDRFPDMNEMVEDFMLEKLALIPDKTKFVASSGRWSRIAQLPEILYVECLTAGKDFLTLLGEILNRRWQTLDLISMMEEVERDLLRKALPADYQGLRYVELRHGWRSQLVIKDTLSSVPRFQKKEEQDSVV